MLVLIDSALLKFLYYAQGESNIIVELPDVADPQEAKAMIGRAAVLEFKHVEKYGYSEKELLYEFDGELPDDLEILPGESEGGRQTYYVVQKYARVTGSMLSDARAAMQGEPVAKPCVSFVFNSDGGDKFHELTSKNFGKQIAIVLMAELSPRRD